MVARETDQTDGLLVEVAQDTQTRPEGRLILHGGEAEVGHATEIGHGTDTATEDEKGQQNRNHTFEAHQISLLDLTYKMHVHM